MSTFAIRIELVAERAKTSRGHHEEVEQAVGKVVRSRPACNWIRSQVIEVLKAGGQVNVQIRRRS